MVATETHKQDQRRESDGEERLTVLDLMMSKGLFNKMCGPALTHIKEDSVCRYLEGENAGRAE